MKISTLLALASLVGTMTLPAMGFAQGKGRGPGHHDKGPKGPKGPKGRPGPPDHARNDKWNRDRPGPRRDPRRDDRRPDPRRENDRRFENERRERENLQNLSNRRQQTKNEWRNIAYASGALAVYGLLRKDNTLTFAGAAGALYSLNRYEQDRKSQASIDRARASYFSRPYFVRDGQRFDRRTMVKGGQKYYQFVRGR